MVEQKSVHICCCCCLSFSVWFILQNWWDFTFRRFEQRTIAIPTETLNHKTAYSQKVFSNQWTPRITLDCFGLGRCTVYVDCIHNKMTTKSQPILFRGARAHTHTHFIDGSAACECCFAHCNCIALCMKCGGQPDAFSNERYTCGENKDTIQPD